MQIDADGNMELSAEENQALMDQLDIPPEQYDDPPVAIEYTGMKGDAAVFTATNTDTGKSVVLEFDAMQPDSH